MDPYRVAAHEKLRSFAGIIGVGFTAVNSVQELTGAIEEARVKSVVLVDTPGYSPAEIGQPKKLQVAWNAWPINRCIWCCPRP